MAVNAVRIRTASGWQDIALQGEPGPDGPTGPPAAVVQAAEPIPRNEVVLWVDTDDVPPPVSASPIAFVSVLPSSPTDATEIYFQTTAMATDGVVWHLRYRSASSSAYKWEVVGGSGLLVTTANEDTMSGNSNSPDAGYVENTTTTRLTMPLAGDYEFDFGAVVGGSAGWGNFWLNVMLNNVQPLDTYGVHIDLELTSNADRLFMGHKHVRTVLAAGHVAALVGHRWGIANPAIRNRHLSARPVRVG